MELEVIKSSFGLSAIAFVFIILVAVIFYVWKGLLEAKNLLLQNKLLKQQLGE